MPLCVCVHDREREKQEHKLLCVFFCLGKKKKMTRQCGRCFLPGHGGSLYSLLREKLTQIGHLRGHPGGSDPAWILEDE